MRPDWIRADWPAPRGIRALCTTRVGGCSEGPWATMNLGGNCGDDPERVSRNRAILEQDLPGKPLWLKQVHGVDVIDHRVVAEDSESEADAQVAFEAGQICSVLTADCLPVLFCSRNGDRVAAAHAGWRGLANGVLQATVNALECDPGDLLAWLGPGIGPAAYEVGQDVLDAFSGDFPNGFKQSGDHWLMDMYTLARLKLAAAGVIRVYGGNWCTFGQEELFFSYRRDGITGRMASLVWIEERQ